MSDDEDTDDTPAVTLGDGTEVPGVPLARVSSRLTWGMARSELLDREGDTPIRTHDGPRELDEIFEEIETQYFESRQAFESTVRDVIGVGPVQTESDNE